MPIAFPAWSCTVPARLIVYVPCALASQVAAGALIVYVTALPLTENPVTVAPWFTVMFDVPNVLAFTPDVASAYVSVIFVVDVPPVIASIIGAGVVMDTEGATVSTWNVARFAFAAMAFPARSLTVVDRLTVYVSWALSLHVAAGAEMVYVTALPLTENPVTVAP